MQFSENWLRSFVNPAMDTQALSHALTMTGLEVEELTPVAPAFEKIVIGEIVSVMKHPDADRLQVCQVNVGSQTLQIVCGASNARVGLKAPCALVGAELPGISIKQAKVRGVESFGMMCSSKELGLAADATGLLELPANAPVGQDIREHLDLNDHLFTLKLTPNRADCLSILGIARDVVAMTGAPLVLPEIATPNLVTDNTIPVHVLASESCPAYYGRVIEGVNAQTASPDWMVRRLERSGIRSISALVDITNYVLLELGQPMHAFDLAKLQKHIEVRFAQKDEQLALLNGNTVKFAQDDLVIADVTGPIALAGIMGGELTSVSETTQSIFLESAFFVPDVIAGKARRIGLSTDSSYRFERGVDFGNTKHALERATQLVLSICGGSAGPITQSLANLPVRNQVKLRYSRLQSVLGIEIPYATVGQLLTQLGFTYTDNNEVFLVQAPSYRFDIAREEDLIEEIARLYGYDKIPAITPHANLTMLECAESTQNSAVLRDALQSQGYQEVITYSFVEEAWEKDLLGNPLPIRLKNPIASNLSVMRSGLWGGLLDVLSYNLNRKQDRALLFEMGSSYHAAASGYEEQQKVAGLFYGDFQPEQWSSSKREVDFYDVKATVDMLTHQQAEYRVESHSALHPGQTARIYINGQAQGWLGKLHPKWQQHYNLAKSAFLFELNVQALLATSVPSYQEVSKFLGVRRDIAVIVDVNIQVQSMIQAVKSANIPLLQHIQLFDVYQGKGIAENKKSLAFLVLIQDTHKTLVDTEAEAAMAELLKILENQFGAELRN
jgi:phenylalanyl-tRNA synthetase beta chain